MAKLTKKQKEELKAKLDSMEDDEREGFLEVIKEFLGGPDGNSDVFEQLKSLTERVAKLETPVTPPPKKGPFGGIFD